LKKLLTPHNHKCCRKVKYSAQYIGVYAVSTCGKNATYTNGSHYFCTLHSKMQRYVVRVGDIGEILCRADTLEEITEIFNKIERTGIIVQKLSNGKRINIYNLFK